MTDPKDKEPLVLAWLEESKLLTPEDWERICRELGPQHRIPFGMAYGMGAERLRQKIIEQSNHARSLPRKKTLKQRLKHTFNQLLCRVFGHKTNHIRIRNSYVFQCPRCKAVWK